MTLRGGGKVKVKDIPTDSDVEIVESLWLPAIPGTTYQLSAVIEIHKDAAGGGDGYINAVTSRARSADPGRWTGTKAGHPNARTVRPLGVRSPRWSRWGLLLWIG